MVVNQAKILALAIGLYNAARVMNRDGAALYNLGCGDAIVFLT